MNSNLPKTVDLRSDTVTLPTEEMREAIARAELGDDGYGEDATVNQLERLAAAMLGKEAAMLVPSGTMGNLSAMLTYCARGTKAFLGSKAHAYVYEAGAATGLGGVVIAPIQNSTDGEFNLDQLRDELERPPDPHFSPPALVALENTHNLCAGAAVELSHMAVVTELAHSHSLPVHLDGARIFNAALALETSARQIASFTDSVSFCLSKGLACPIGSLLCGSAEFIAHARRIRQILGGAMRQAGIIAAAGLVALDAMIDRLAEDHLNARTLAEGLSQIIGIKVHSVKRPTNMVVFDIAGNADAASTFAANLKEQGVLVGRRGPATFSAVTHYGISRAGVNRAVRAASEAVAAALV